MYLKPKMNNVRKKLLPKQVRPLSSLEQFTQNDVMKRIVGKQPSSPREYKVVGDYSTVSTQENYLVEERIKKLVRSMAKDLKKYLDDGNCLSSFTHSNFTISTSGRANFVNIELVEKTADNIQRNYKDLHKVVLETVFRGFSLQHQIPSDWRHLLGFMQRSAVGNEVLIHNHAALLPLSNRILFFLKAYEFLKFDLGQRDNPAMESILKNLPYSKDWSQLLRGNHLLEASFSYKAHDISGAPEGFLDFYRHTNARRMDRCLLIAAVGAYRDEDFEIILLVRYPLYLPVLQEKLHEAGFLGELKLESCF